MRRQRQARERQDEASHHKTESRSQRGAVSSVPSWYKMVASISATLIRLAPPPSCFKVTCAYERPVSIPHVPGGSDLNPRFGDALPHFGSSLTTGGTAPSLCSPFSMLWKSRISEYIITFHVSTGRSASLKLQSKASSASGSSVSS